MERYIEENRVKNNYLKLQKEQQKSKSTTIERNSNVIATQFQKEQYL